MQKALYAYRSKLLEDHFGLGGLDADGRFYLVKYPNMLYWSEDGSLENLRLRYVFSDLTSDVRGFFIDSRKNVFIGTIGLHQREGGSVHRSSDHGKSFQELNLCSEIGLGKCFWGFDEDTDGNLYLGVYLGENEAAEVWKSIDGGESWINISDPSWVNTRHIHNVRIDPSTGWLYAATGDTDGFDGVWRSKRKDGSDWTLKFGDRKNRLQFIGIAFKEGNIFLGCDSRFSQCSLYKTRDDGSSGKIMPEGVTSWGGWGVFYLEKDGSGRLWATQRPLHAKGAVYTSDDGLDWTLRTMVIEESIQEWRKSHTLRDGMRGETGDRRSLFRRENDNIFPWRDSEKDCSKHVSWLETKVHLESEPLSRSDMRPPNVDSPIKLRTIKKQLFTNVWGFRKATSKIRAMPDFLIIGGQRCGTTSLFNYIIEHPHILRPIRKEIHYFDLNYDRSIDWYRSHFPISYLRKGFITGEASPYYIFHPHALRRIAETLPDVKLIVILRNPVDRAYSHYQYEVKLGVENLDLKEALDSEDGRVRGEIERMLIDEYMNSYNHRHFTYVSRGRYFDQIKRVFEYFPKDQTLIVENGELLREPQRVLESVFRFLDVGDWKQKIEKKYNVGSYEEMDNVLRQRLTSVFKGPNKELYNLLGEDFGWDR